MRPPAMPLSANSAGRRSHTERARPIANTRIIKIGKSQSARSPPRARLSPLAESFIPIQLTCTHGRKKQISTNRDALRVVRLALSIWNYLACVSFNSSVLIISLFNKLQLLCRPYPGADRKLPEMFRRGEGNRADSQFSARSEERPRWRRVQTPYGTALMFNELLAPRN